LSWENKKIFDNFLVLAIISSVVGGKNSYPEQKRGNKLRGGEILSPFRFLAKSKKGAVFS